MYKECFYSWYGIFSFPLRFPFLSSIFSFFLFSFFSSCQSYHFALGFHFSGALMGAVMESWLTGRADFHTLMMTSPLARFHFTSNQADWKVQNTQRRLPPSSHPCFIEEIMYSVGSVCSRNDLFVQNAANASKWSKKDRGRIKLAILPFFFLIT